MRRVFNILIIAFAVGLTLSSCREELCYGHNHGANIKFNIDWMVDWDLYWSDDWSERYDNSFDIDSTKLYMNEAEGVRVIVYPWDSEVLKYKTHFSNIGGNLILDYGMYDCLFYNNDTEYIQFNDNDKAELSVATTRSRSVMSYSMSDSLEENVVNQPDMLFSAGIDSLVVEYSESSQHNMDGGYLMVQDRNVTMYPLVHTYIIRVNIEIGAEYVTVARGKISNMAGSVQMMSGKTLNDMVTLQFDESDKDSNGVTAYIKSFGLCNYDPSFHNIEARGFYENVVLGRNDRPRSDGSEKNILTVQLALESRKIKTVEFDITEQLRKQPRGGLIVVNGVEITPAEGAGQGGSFDIDLNPWNTENHYIQMGN